MPWQPLLRIAFAVATYPFAASGPADLPLEIGDELYIIEETPDGNWLRGYLVAPPSLLTGLTSVKGQTLEARVFSGIFPRSCVEIREFLGESEDTDDNSDATDDHQPRRDQRLVESDSAKSGLIGDADERRLPIQDRHRTGPPHRERRGRKIPRELPNGTRTSLSVPVKREPGAPRPPAPVPMLKIGDESPTSAAEPLIDEIASCLREWHSTNLHELLLTRQYSRLDQLSQLINSLYLSRQQLLHNVLANHELKKLREKTVWDLVRVNKLCGGEVIVRDPRERGRVLTGDDSVVETTKLQSMMSLLNEPPQPTLELTALHHLLVDVRGFAGASSEETSLALYLLTKSAGGQPVPLSETFTVQIPAGGTMGSLAKSGQLKTLFADLSAQDIGDVPSVETELYLVIQVRATQQVMGGGKPQSRSGQKSQPFSKEPPKPNSSSGKQTIRRSLMWGSKNSRTAFSRGREVAKLDALTEQQESGGVTQAESRDGYRPPSTAGSLSRTGSIDDSHVHHAMAERTVGVGILKLNSIMKQYDSIEQVVSIWSPSPSPSFASEKQGPEEDSDVLIRELLDSRSGRYEKSRRAERVQVQLKAFNHPDADALIKATPTLLSGVCKSSKMGFSGAPTKPRSDIYVTLDQATLSRHTLLSRFGGNPTAIPGNVHGNNLQVTLEVRNNQGKRIENCVFASSNSEGVSVWKSLAAEKGDSWNQTIRLSVSPRDVFTAHVVMLLSDAPNPPFAVAHMPLWNQQAFVRDGAHALLLYKLDENTSTAHGQASGKGGYLSVQWSARGDSEHSAEVTGPLATLRTHTYLCSTRFSQDKVVLGLLKWKEVPKEEVPKLLNHLIFVPEIEVVKLLSDVLDALFGILVEHSGNDEYEDLVFTALVRVLGIVHDRRFNLGPLVDQYAENRFNYPFATPCLVRSFTRLLENPTEPETSRKLRSTFKVVRHILKFITHARGQQKAKEAGIGLTTSSPGFTRHLRSIFKALDAMMRNPAPVLVGSQTLAVQHFHTWLPELSGLLTTEEILHVAIDFMDACSEVKGKLVLYKLVLVINYSKLDLFSHPEQKAALTANTVRWIEPHWGHQEQVTDLWKDQVRLCCSVLATQLDSLGPEIPDHIPKLIDSYLCIKAAPIQSRSRLSLLFPMSYPFTTKPITVADEITYDESLIELSAILSAVSNSPSGMQLELGEEDMSLLLENVLRVYMSILSGEAFPSHWLSVHIHHHKSIMGSLQYLSTIMLESFLPDPDDAEHFNTELWRAFFSTLLKLVGSPGLALETFPEQKRRAVWKIAGDVREHGAELLRRTWEAIGWDASPEERAKYGLQKLGGYQVQYVPTQVGPIVELCLSVHEGLRRMAVEVLQTMIVSEWTLGEDLSVIQTEMIDCLDQYFKSKPLTESILQKLFVSELLERFEPLSQVPDEPLYAAMRDLIGTVDEFLDLLVAVHSGDVTSEASHLINRLRLMEFLRDMQKEEIFIRYVHQLSTLQSESRNHTEAGLALRLHADLYDWDPARQVGALAEPEFPAQTHFERKERIYFEMIKHFEEGEAWNVALAAYKELQVQYETNVFDFAKLARTERAIATIYETISKSEKLVPKYFKVVYKGLGFPPSLRDKEFVFEGSPTERASAFTDRMQEQYPSAQIISGGDVDDAEGQYLVISAISPHRDLSHHVFQRSRVPQVIRDYLISSGPQAFSVSSKRNTSGPVTEHYAEKLVYTTADPFPTILRRSEIVHVDEIRLNAHQTGLERIVRKTQEMSTIEKRISEGDEENAQLLVDAVSVSVNANSENSVSCYRRLLPVPEMEDEEVELSPQDNAIRMALLDHAIMLKRCLATFSRSSNPALNRVHEELQRHFESTFAPEIAMFAPPQPLRETPVAPSPTWRRSTRFEPGSPPLSLTAAVMSNGLGILSEEASAVQPVSIRQGRGARLSLLGGRKKDQSSSPQTNGDRSGTHEKGETFSDRSKSMDKDQGARRSFFRSPANGPAEAEGTEWVITDSGGRQSSDVRSSTADKENDERPPSSGGNGMARMGSVRKRFSMLRLGKKSSRGNVLMGSVDEE
ncbi:SH3 domain-containing protein [Sodiomyces alkalinus F11]|uniref:SH3 domain-containing protein n=1 Tax=Sodiomyces alkalinus (strain CBS 110278 / VKM F-3762 / F11) TaxID=1314773 RepID=A0A3N2Q6S3_SODAK|nr:SH3 domain-containing protein [Sodiomyces alkalinus F11]ROT42397.1 SH3 domain-containing protein [Sodiomyces alkalinus F11]